MRCPRHDKHIFEPEWCPACKGRGMSKPREWWLFHQDWEYTDINLHDEQHFIHVVEKSAYDELKAALEKIVQDHECRECCIIAAEVLERHKK